MQEYQKKLLTLLKEIDAICSKHGITYYCSGGTVIGAARHGGFIPWDDDIDVCMTRPDFERFCEVFRSDPPEGRCLLYNENDPDYHSTIPRYAETGTTSFCRYHLLGRVPAGASIDIFILEAVPDEPALQRDFIRKFFIYSDFVMPFYCFSHRVPADHLDDYAGYRRMADEEGERAVIERLHDELFPAAAGDSENVCLLWASSPSVFPRKIFGQPARLPFEDTEICVPGDWYTYLVLEYGMDWMQVPYGDVQEGHITINRLDVSYEHCYELRDSLYTEDYLETVFRERKAATFEYEKRHRPLLDARCKIKAGTVTAALRNAVDSAGKDPSALYAAGDASGVIDLFIPYLDVQLSRWFIGSRTRFHYYRYMYPVIIDIPVGWLRALLDSMLATGRFRDLYKLLDAYRKAGIENPATESAGKALAFYREAESLYYYGKYNECLAVCETCSYPQIKDAMGSLRLGCEAVLDPQTVISDADAIEASGNIMRIKALADAYFAAGDTARAKEMYETVLKGSRNGMLWNDIRLKTCQTPDSVFNEPPYSPAWQTAAENSLLDEVVKICERHGIAYVLSPKLSARLASTGNPGYKPDRKIIYMTVENARAFVSAFEGNPPEARRLVSWKNDENIDDLVLEYSLADSVSVNLRDIRNTVERGIGVTIRVLRTGSPYSPRSLHMRSLEHSAHNDSSKKRSCFEYVMKHGSGDGNGDYYYYTGRPGKRPVRKLVSRNLIDDACALTVGNMAYIVPRSAVSGHDRKAAGTRSEKRYLPENLFYSADIGRTDFLDIVSRSGLDRIDMAEYDRNAALSREADAKVDGIWETLVSREKDI